MTLNWESLTTSWKDGMPLRFEIYAQIPSSAKPEPPIVTGSVDNTVEAEVANNDPNKPI